MKRLLIATMLLASIVQARAAEVVIGQCPRYGACYYVGIPGYGWVCDPASVQNTKVKEFQYGSMTMRNMWYNAPCLKTLD